MMTYAQIEAALASAAYHADVLRPKETGWNRGYWVERYQRSAGIPAGSPWCAAFVTYHLVQAGLTELPVHRGRVASWVGWAKGHERLAMEPQRGDLFAWVNDDSTGHMGFVASVYRVGPARWLRTIEGNTDSDGTREGDGVYRKVRLVTSRLRFIRVGDD